MSHPNEDGLLIMVYDLKNKQLSFKFLDTRRLFSSCIPPALNLGDGASFAGADWDHKAPLPEILSPWIINPLDQTSWSQVSAATVKKPVIYSSNAAAIAEIYCDKPRLYSDNLLEDSQESLTSSTSLSGHKDYRYLQLPPK